MYKVYCDDYLLYDDHLESLVIIYPKLVMELNKVSSFNFIIYPDHPYYEKLIRMKSIIKVYQEDVLIFKGRIASETIGFYNERQVMCEGQLAFLLDSIQRPYGFEGTPAELFTKLIESHNEQVDVDHQFKVGNVTVTDPNDYIARSDSTYLNTFDSIQQKLIEGLGGYLWIRHESDGDYIDYLSEFNTLSPQKIEFSKNLLSMTRKMNADEIVTVIIPVGAKIEDTEDKLTIEDVNDGKDYLEDEIGIELYGRIVKMVEWQDVTEPDNLKRKGQKYLDEHVLMPNTIELTTADLPNMTPFHLGTNVQIISQPHKVDRIFLVNKLSVDILNPANNKLSLGSTDYSLTEKQNEGIKTLNTQIVTKVENAKTEVITSTTKSFQSNIQSTSDSIMSSVSENYYLKDQTDELIESLRTSIEQTSSGIELRFEQFNKDLKDYTNKNDATYKDISKYIRFVDGKIILGEVGNELELQIANDKMSFIQNNSEVAYFSNNRLYVVDGEFTNSLQLGKFAFLPRTNGNLSFKFAERGKQILIGNNTICSDETICGSFT